MSKMKQVATAIIFCLLAYGSSRANNTLISVTNVWRYGQDGLDRGTAWREPNFDDSQWPQGKGLLYYETNTLPAPKSTLLSLTNSEGRPIITYYFRTRFAHNG